ncbi:dihydroxyacetone kinase family protein [Microbacterium sp. SORGH_AS_0888]|uniref:dihydroxyacetone kinase family protein n=1 Tax=Microbacterium sp. SORGH_AS_0888 TaxID=3041791 RepID=UPI0027817E67|nr:dihydroxyacetone kinase family protein [Microbacterium sp. SORGH_AS_0888]MDQ1129662.1 dihydroxyacetone kinase [Microbacterium sp. SORGH_AS_0888]
MPVEKILNAPGDVIEDYIAGLVRGTGHLARVEGWPVVVREPATRKSPDRVALVTGGGSGHEPAHAGYVGEGMLDAAVLGPVFTSPSVDAVHAAIRAVATDAGVLLIVKNYTGDRLNFGLAAEMARVEGIAIEIVVVADDAALGDRSRAGRRGLTATVLVHKLAGAAAEAGASLAEIAELCRRFLLGAATMGVALGACVVPGAAEPSFALAPGEVEWGLGIHGEAGSERGALVTSREIADRLVDAVVRDRGLGEGDRVVALVNSLGATPDLELRILHGDVLAALERRRLDVRLTWAAPFLTSLEMPGASLTLARLDDETAALLASPARTLAFPAWSAELRAARTSVVPAPHRFEVGAGEGPRSDDVARLHARAAALAAALEAAEPELTALDRTVGDGDLGINLARGAAALRAAGDLLGSLPDASAYLAGLSQIVRHEVGGTSGPLYSILLLAMSESLAGSGASPAARRWADAFAAGVERIRTIGGAAPGDSTMVDALQPAVDALAADPADLAAAAAAADAGARATAALRPSLGRSSYVGERAVGVPDPGATAVALQLEVLRRELGC